MPIVAKVHSISVYCTDTTPRAKSRPWSLNYTLGRPVTLVEDQLGPVHPPPGSFWDEVDSWVFGLRYVFLQS